jgi:Leucine-rich repeat (LRR) protein
MIHLKSGSLLDQLGGFTQLEYLKIEGLHIGVLPGQIANLTMLRYLIVDDNRLREFPAALLELDSLQYLNLSSTTGQIQEIPRGILRMKSLNDLRLTGHPIHTPPPEIVKEGIGAIRDFWRQREEEGVDHLCEAKLLIL